MQGQTKVFSMVKSAVTKISHYSNVVDFREVLRQDVQGFTNPKFHQKQVEGNFK